MLGRVVPLSDYYLPLRRGGDCRCDDRTFVYLSYSYSRSHMGAAETEKIRMGAALGLDRLLIGGVRGILIVPPRCS